MYFHTFLSLLIFSTVWTPIPVGQQKVSSFRPESAENHQRSTPTRYNVPVWPLTELHVVYELPENG